MRYRPLSLLPIAILFVALAAGQQSRPPRAERWSAEQAQEWCRQYPWLVGANFNPSTAINQLEMWRAGDFDPDTIDRELGYAEAIGFNCMRVYLHDLAYEQDPEGFLDRIDQYLAIADRHGIVTMFVIFDDCWNSRFTADQQFEPVPGVHNSGWLQSPGGHLMATYPDDAQLQQRLERYVKAVLTRFADDQRILAWDLYNEPGNTGVGATETYQQSFMLVKDVFGWAREVNPSQPLTVCHWRHDENTDPMSRYSIDHSDLVTYHNYSGPENLRAHTESIIRLADGRPVICTEYMARPRGSTFEGTLPIFAEFNVGAINWGFAAGRSNTIYPWSSWDQPGKLPEPDVWFHDIVRPDGSPYSEDEVEFIRQITAEQRK